MTHGSLFSGIGGFDLAASWMGWDNIFQCEKDGFCRRVLKFHFSKTTLYEDIRKTDFTQYRGQIDVLSGGFPCQPFSIAGQRKGADDDRYLWPEMLRAIREIRPAWVIGENVAGIISMVQPGREVEVESQTSLFEEDYKETVLKQEYVIETICRDLEREGYSVQPVVIPACAIGAPHRRDRIWFIAHSDNYGYVAPKNRWGNFERNDCHQTGQEAVKQSQGCSIETIVTHAGGERREARIRTQIDNNRNGRDSEYFPENRYEIRSSINATCAIWPVANPYCERQPDGNPVISWEKIPDIEKRVQDNGKTDGLRSNRIAAHSHSHIRRKRRSNTNRPQKAKRYISIRDTWEIRDPWRIFPTQSPVCSGNDGLPTGLDGITFSKWRAESIKSYGNAIVPQVAYRIFKAIENSHK